MMNTRRERFLRKLKLKYALTSREVDTIKSFTLAFILTYIPEAHKNVLEAAKEFDKWNKKLQS